MDKTTIKSGAKWVVDRLKEPSTYAGIGVAALAVAEVAKDAKGVAVIFKEQGTSAGLVALGLAVIAIVRAERDKHAPIVVEPEKSDNGN